MKNPILIPLLLFATTSFCQVKPVKKAPALSQKAIYTNKAKAWFKDVYVQSYFKDPYSYKLMKIIVSPITLGSKVKYAMSTLESELYVLDTAKSYSDYGSKLSTYKFYVNRERILGHDTTTLFNYVLDEKYQDVKKELDKYIKIKSTLDSAKITLSKTPKSALSNIVEYFVYLDCYGRNGYGNLVLNKYTFTLGLDGEGTDVKSLNDD